MRHLTWLLFAFGLLWTFGSLAAATPAKPNVLFILTDDQGWATLGCYGSERVHTPHLDRLAGEGMRFTDAYVMPQCTPTRAALLTGQHTARTRMWHVIPWYGYPWARVAEPAMGENLPRESFTIAKGLKAAGYTTAIIGKWHLTANADGHYVMLKPEAAGHYGFDVSPAPPSARYHQQGDKGVDWLTDQAGAFIEKVKDRPWFLYLAHHTVHNPLSAPEALVQRYRQKGAPEKGLHNASILAMLEHMDASVGRLLARLDELGLRDNTIVVFESDNGGVHRSWLPTPRPDEKGAWRLEAGDSVFDNAPLREGKGSLYEGGLRVPLIVRWPGTIKPGSVCTTPVHVVDWMPTFLEIAGGSAPKDHPLDGVSLLPLFKGQPIAPRPLHWYAPFYDLRWGATPCAVIRDGDFKLIESFGDSVDAQGRYRPGRRIEMFNLKDDVSESNNLADQQPDRREAMVAKLHAWMKGVSAEIPQANPRHDPKRELEETRQKP